MTWMEWVNILMRYYPGLNHTNIPKMTVWQFVYSIKNIGMLEKHQATESSAALGQSPGEVPSIATIRAMARRINPKLTIPKDG